jgi:hypothetical protein
MYMYHPEYHTTGHARVHGEWGLGSSGSIAQAGYLRNKIFSITDYDCPNIETCIKIAIKTVGQQMVYVTTWIYTLSVR